MKPGEFPREVRLVYVTHSSPWKGAPRHEDMVNMTIGKIYDVEVLWLNNHNEKLNECEVTNDLGERIRILQGHLDLPKPSACECGAKKAHNAERGSPLHSSWCPESKPEART